MALALRIINDHTRLSTQNEGVPRDIQRGKPAVTLCNSVFAFRHGPLGSATPDIDGARQRGSGVDMSVEIAPFKLGFAAVEIEQFLARAREVLVSGWLIPGLNNAEFERRFAEFVGVAEATAVASGTGPTVPH